jgi:hypothetical protein
LRLPGWICVTCERPFRRRWNAKRHVNTQHSDESAEIVTFVDYLVGRYSGVYGASSPMRKPPTNLGQFKPSTSNIDLLQAQTRKSATDLQDILRVFEPHERYKQGESLTQSMTREFDLELARQAARNVLNQQGQQPLSATQGQLRPAPFSYSNFLNPTGNENEIFGFRGHTCSKCLMKEHFPVSYSTDNKIGARFEVKHTCRPVLLANNQNLDDKVRASSVELMRNTLPSYLKYVVNLWTSEKVVLLAIELPGDGPPTPDPKANDQIKILSPRNTKAFITFQRSMEKHVELNPDRGGTGNPNHWSSRVIQQGSTSLTGNELEEFLKALQNATFGIFKIYVDNKDNCNNIDDKSPHQQQQKLRWMQQRTIHWYFMYLSRMG